MSTKKRKADYDPNPGAATAGGIDGVDATGPAPPKKSKMLIKAEQLARAKAWHDARNGKAGGGGGAGAAAASSPSSIAHPSSSPPPFSSAGRTTTAAPSSSSKQPPAARPPLPSSPRYSAGTAAAPSKPSGVAAKRRRTTTPSGGGRKSTGGQGRASASPPTSSSQGGDDGGGRGAPPAARKSRKSAGSVAPAFAHAPPAREEEEEEEEEGPEMSEVAMVGSGRGSSGGERKISANEKKRRDGLAAIRALKEARTSRGGLAADSGTEERRKGLPKADSPCHPPPSASAAAASVARAPSDSPAAALSALSAAAHAVSAVGSAGSAAPKRKRPPASVASLFSPRPASIEHPASAAAPGRGTYDPDRPFPTAAGRALPAAAHAGCGPRCGAGAGYPGRNGSRDERKMPPRPSPPGRDETVAPHPPKPSPPGRNRNGEEADGGAKQDAVDGRAKEAAVVGGERVEAPVPSTPGHVASAPAANTALLHASISRARAMMSSASAGNKKRREMMGIRVSDAGGNLTFLSETRAGVLAPSEQDMDAANATMHDEGNGGVRGRSMERMGSADEDRSRGKSVDPPMIDSSPFPRSAALQKFRVSAEANKTPEGRSKREPGNVFATTDAGEHTSEVGGNAEDAKPSASTIVMSEPDKPHSFLGRSCIGIGKLLMFVQFGIGLFFLTTAYYQGYFVPTETFITPANTLEEDRVHCFIDYPHSDVFSNDGDQNLYDERKCEGRHKQCPQWGRCRAGKLLDCIDGAGTFAGLNLFVPNENGDECAVSPEANDLVGVVKDILVGITADQFCHTEVDGVMLKNDDTFPLFRFEKVAARMRDLHEGRFAFVSSDLLLWLSPAFDSNLVRFGSLSDDYEGDFDGMSLGQGISPDSLSLPSGCRMKLLFSELLGYLSTYAFALLKYMASVFLYLVWQYPIHSFGAMAFWYLFLVIQRKRKHRAKVRELVTIVREAAYDRLSECDDHTGYAALLLRDDVGNEMYPTSFAQRQFVNDYVWPRVVLEVRADNRVRKFRKMTAGKELEHWDFAIQSKKGRRLRKSLGTPVVGTPGGANGGGINAEDVPPRRDP